jgi:hypothetical protein
MNVQIRRTTLASKITKAREELMFDTASQDTAAHQKRIHIEGSALESVNRHSDQTVVAEPIRYGCAEDIKALTPQFLDLRLGPAASGEIELVCAMSQLGDARQLIV